MTITIKFTKVEDEMLKEPQKKDKSYKMGLEVKVKQTLIQTTNQFLNQITASMVPELPSNAR